MYVPTFHTLLWECVIVWFLLCAFLLLVYKLWGGALVVEVLDGCEGGEGLIVMYLCV